MVVFLKFNIYIQNNLVNATELPVFFAAAYAGPLGNLNGDNKCII